MFWPIFTFSMILYAKSKALMNISAILKFIKVIGWFDFCGLNSIIDKSPSNAIQSKLYEVPVKNTRKLL